MKKLVLAIVIALFCVLSIAPTADAADQGMFFRDTAGGYWDACRATLPTPATSYSVAATVKTIIALKPDSNVQTGWQLYAGWSYPKSFYSYAVDHMPLGYLVEDIYLSNNPWNYGRLYELRHDSWLWNTHWDIYIQGAKKASVIARNLSGKTQVFQEDQYYAGGKTSNSTDRLGARVRDLQLRYPNGWANFTASSRIQTGHFTNPIVYNNYYNFLYPTNNW